MRSSVSPGWTVEPAMTGTVRLWPLSSHAPRSPLDVEVAVGSYPWTHSCALSPAWPFTQFLTTIRLNVPLVLVNVQDEPDAGALSPFGIARLDVTPGPEPTPLVHTHVVEYAPAET